MRRERRGSPTRSARSGTAWDGVAMGMVGGGDVAAWFWWEAAKWKGGRNEPSGTEGSRLATEIQTTVK